MSSKKHQIPDIRFKGFTDAWEQRKLISEIDKVLDYRGKSPTKFGMKWESTGYLVLSALNVKDGYIDKAVDAKCGNQALFERWMGFERLEKGDVIFTTEAPLGNVAQIPDDDGYILNQRAVGFKTNPDNLNNNFLAQLLRSPLFQDVLQANASGGTAKGIGMKEFAKLDVMIPLEIVEQKQIGNFFNLIDDTIALHQRQLDNYKELKKAMLKKIFNQELKFKDQDGNDYPDWKEKKLGEISEIRTGYTPSRKDKNNFGGDIIWVSVADMKTKYIYDTKEYLSEKDVREAKWIEADTLIMSFKLSVGVLAITKKKCMSNEAIANFKWKNDITNNEYMFAYLSSQDISTYGNNAAQGISLNNESLREIRVQVPCKGEQQKIAGFFIALDKQLEKLVQTVELLKEQKKRLMQQMFC